MSIFVSSSYATFLNADLRRFLALPSNDRYRAEIGHGEPHPETRDAGVLKTHGRN